MQLVVLKDRLRNILLCVRWDIKWWPLPHEFILSLGCLLQRAFSHHRRSIHWTVSVESKRRRCCGRDGGTLSERLQRCKWEEFRHWWCSKSYSDMKFFFCF